MEEVTFEALPQGGEDGARAGRSVRQELVAPELMGRWSKSRAVDVSGKMVRLTARRKVPFKRRERRMLSDLHGHLVFLVGREWRLTAVPGGFGLTQREREVLAWLVEGKTDPEMSLILGLSLRTVHTHVSRILDKMGIENRASAIVEVWRWRCGAQA